jgi:hypothetical protein
VILRFVRLDDFDTDHQTERHLRDNKIADKVAAQGEWLKGKLAELQKRYPVIGPRPRTWPITG